MNSIIIKKLMPVLVGVLLITYGSAQRLDSLKQNIVKASTDTAKMMALIALGNEVVYSNPDTAIVIGKQAYRLAKKSGSVNHLGNSLSSLGVYYDIKGEYPTALEYYLKCQAIWEEISDQNKLAACFNNIGIVYMEQANYPMALEYYTKSLEIKIRLGDKPNIATTYGNIGNVHLSMSDYAKALEFYFKAVEMHEQLGKKRGLADWFTGIGLAYRRQHDLTKALEYYQRAMKIDEEVGDKYGLGADYNNIAVVYKAQLSYSKVLEYNLKSLKIRKELGNQNDIATSYNNMAELYLKVYEGDDSLRLSIGQWAYENPKQLLDSVQFYDQAAFDLNKKLDLKESMIFNLLGIGELYQIKGMFRQSIEASLQSIKISQAIGDREEKFNAYQLIADTYKHWAEKTSNLPEKTAYYAKAYEFHEKYVKLKDSVLDEHKQNEIGKLEAKHEFEIAKVKKEHEDQEKARIEAEHINRRNNLQYAGILLALCAIFGGIFFISKRKLPKWAVEFSVFVPFLIFFEFLLVLFDPFGQKLTGGEPGYALLINTALAGLIFPIHNFFERLLKKRLFGKTLVGS